jgi:hypothetical protein
MKKFLSYLFVLIGTCVKNEYGFLAWKEFVIYIPTLVSKITIYNLKWLLEAVLTKHTEIE